MRALILLAALLAFPAHAIEWGPYIGRYVKAYDGDTVTLNILIWPDLVKNANVRIKGIDAPEIRGDCKAEKDKAKAARDYLRELLIEAGSVFVTVHGFDKYGRPLADIEIQDKDLGEMLIEAGHARRYEGGTRLSWCGDPS